MSSTSARSKSPIVLPNASSWIKVKLIVHRPRIDTSSEKSRYYEHRAHAKFKSFLFYSLRLDRAARHDDESYEHNRDEVRIISVNKQQMRMQMNRLTPFAAHRRHWLLPSAATLVHFRIFILSHTFHTWRERATLHSTYSILTRVQHPCAKEMRRNKCECATFIPTDWLSTDRTMTQTWWPRNACSNEGYRNDRISRSMRKTLSRLPFV